MNVQVQIEKKRKKIKIAKSYFINLFIGCKKCFFVNWPCAHSLLSMFCASSKWKYIVLLRNYTINTCIRMLYHVINEPVLYNRSCKLATCPLGSSTFDWGELFGAVFSADVTTKRDCQNSVDVKRLWRIIKSSGDHEHDAEHENIHDTFLE